MSPPQDTLLDTRHARQCTGQRSAFGITFNPSKCSTTVLVPNNGGCNEAAPEELGGWLGDHHWHGRTVHGQSAGCADPAADHTAEDPPAGAPPPARRHHQGPVLRIVKPDPRPLPVDKTGTGRS